MRLWQDAFGDYYYPPDLLLRHTLRAWRRGDGRWDVSDGGDAGPVAIVDTEAEAVALALSLLPEDDQPDTVGMIVRGLTDEILAERKGDPQRVGLLVQRCFAAGVPVHEVVGVLLSHVIGISAACGISQDAIMDAVIERWPGKGGRYE